MLQIINKKYLVAVFTTSTVCISGSFGLNSCSSPGPTAIEKLAIEKLGAEGCAAGEPLSLTVYKQRLNELLKKQQDEAKAISEKRAPVDTSPQAGIKAYEAMRDGVKEMEKSVQKTASELSCLTSPTGLEKLHDDVKMYYQESLHFYQALNGIPREVEALNKLTDSNVVKQFKQLFTSLTKATLTLYEAMKTLEFMTDSFVTLGLTENDIKHFQSVSGEKRDADIEYNADYAAGRIYSGFVSQRLGMVETPSLLGKWPEAERQKYLSNCGTTGKAFCECSLGKIEGSFASEDAYKKATVERQTKAATDMLASCGSLISGQGVSNPWSWTRLPLTAAPLPTPPIRDIIKVSFKGVSVSAISGTESIVLSWSAVPTGTRRVVISKQQGNGTVSTLREIDLRTEPGQGFTDDNVTPGQMYTYYLKALNEDGSTAANAQTAPIPVGLTVNAGPIIRVNIPGASPVPSSTVDISDADSTIIQVLKDNIAALNATNQSAFIDTVDPHSPLYAAAEKIVQAIVQLGIKHEFIAASVNGKGTDSANVILTRRVSSPNTQTQTEQVLCALTKLNNRWKISKMTL